MNDSNVYILCTYAINSMMMDVLSVLQNALDAKVPISETNRRALMHLMEKNPALFGKIQTVVLDIMQDGVIDIHDLPRLIVLVTEMFNLHIRACNFPNVNDVFGILEFVVCAIIQELPFNESQRVMADNIVHSSLMLLRTDLANMKCNTVSSKCCCFT